MGGQPYWYFVPYQDNLSAALAALREREFRAGRYSPVIRYIEFDEPAFSGQNPGSRHGTIEKAVDDAGDSGTRSILDIARIGSQPDYGVAAPLGPGRILELYGSDKPSHRQVEKLEFLDDIERGQCAYVIVYDGGTPSEICFAGYSYD